MPTPRKATTGTFLDVPADRDTTVLYARIATARHAALRALAQRHRVSMARVTDDVIRLGLERVAEIEAGLQEGE